MMIICKFISSYIKEFIRVVVKINLYGLSRPDDEFLCHCRSLKVEYSSVGTLFLLCLLPFAPGQKSIQKCPLQPCFAYHLQIKTVSKIFSDLNRKRLLNSPARKHFLQSLNK